MIQEVYIYVWETSDKLIIWKPEMKVVILTVVWDKNKSGDPLITKEDERDS